MSLKHMLCTRSNELVHLFGTLLSMKNTLSWIRLFNYRMYIYCTRALGNNPLKLSDKVLQQMWLEALKHPLPSPTVFWYHILNSVDINCLYINWRPVFILLKVSGKNKQGMFWYRDGPSLRRQSRKKRPGMYPIFVQSTEYGYGYAEYGYQTISLYVLHPGGTLRHLWSS